jgi:Arc/MetJ-type ribon-helix-helix transcriptional regulator
MDVALTPELELFLKQRAGTERYPSVEAVLAEALELLRTKETEDAKATEDLRSQLKVGLDQLDQGNFVDLKTEQDAAAFFDQVKSQGRARQAAANEGRKLA